MLWTLLNSKHVNVGRWRVKKDKKTTKIHLAIKVWMWLPCAATHIHTYVCAITTSSKLNCTNTLVKHSCTAICYTRSLLSCCMLNLDSIWGRSLIALGCNEGVFLCVHFGCWPAANKTFACYIRYIALPYYASRDGLHSKNQKYVNAFTKELASTRARGNDIELRGCKTPSAYIYVEYNFDSTTQHESLHVPPHTYHIWCLSEWLRQTGKMNWSCLVHGARVFFIACMFPFFLRLLRYTPCMTCI